MADQVGSLDKSQVSDGISSRKDSIEPSAVADHTRIAETALADSDEEPSSEDEQSQIANDSISMSAHARMVEYFRLKAPSVEETERPRPSLQNLPQEMRDEIYSYLLDADTVKYTPDYKSFCHSSDYSIHGGTAHTYRFHTGLFGVNKEVAANSHKYFLSQNSIVEFKFVCPGIRRLLNICGVPILADHGFDEFEHHSFTIAFFSRRILPRVFDYSDPNAADENQVPDLERNGDWDDEEFAERAEGKAESVCGTVLLLQKDLPKLWEMLRLLFQFNVPPTAPLASEAGHNIILAEISKQIGDMTIAVSRYEENMPPSFAKQRTTDFLQGLSTVTGSGYTLAFHGIDLRDTQQVKLDMAPEIIWLRAREWDVFELLNTMKQQADELTVNGNFEAGECRYRLLQSLTDPDAHWANETQDSHAVTASKLVEHLHFDILLSLAWLLLRHGQTPDALGLFDDISETPNNIDEFNDAFENRLEHFDAITDFMVCADDKPHEVYRAANVALNRLKGLPEDEHVSHDIALLSTKLGLTPPPGTPNILIALARHASWQAILCSLSVFALPFRPFHSKADDLDQTRPAGLKGWQDVKHLAQLTTKEKSEIWWKQRVLGY
ncbi:hypothetical protein HII31_05961 [Pseudocercospora fuligena]|uniref:Uncharacterized protein n=1 Tax=Pseudocercospora fuligena TaxID=685502 RepID=A0A8H6VLP2_9PEZI|nr:hypothetical protein HII31_05961 [Pseudocercospora fuligena]